MSDETGVAKRSGTIARAREVTCVGPYRLVREIGIGGMATVHLACTEREESFEKWVAVKTCHPHLAEDPIALRLFLEEGRLGALISHPNVGAVLDVGQEQGRYFIVLEYLQGNSLRAVMRRTRELRAKMPIAIACRIIADAANGLHAAHEARDARGDRLEVVHRDVTPHNLMITDAGVTKVVDFGVAQSTQSFSRGDDGMLHGKVSYMSPEQARGEPVDRRVDVFALGIILWELITGRRLFRGESDLATIINVLDCKIPPPGSITRACPHDLNRIVMRALAVKPNERQGTALELARALSMMLVRRGVAVGSGEVAEYIQNLFADEEPLQSIG